MSEWVEVPFITPPNESVEEIELDDRAATIVDFIPIVVGQELHLVKRPGLAPFMTLGTNLPIDGLYWWDEQHCAIAVSNGRVWKITDRSGSKTELTGSTALSRSQMVSFASDGTKLVMANGGNMVYTDLSTLTTMADADAPTSVSHLAYLDGYILANSTGTQTVNFSAINNLTSWDALDFFSAEGEPDDVLALAEADREIILVGSRSVEFWVNDGTSPFSRLPGAVQSYGISAPYSLCHVGDTWIWLDDNRFLVSMQGRKVVTVSNPFERLIQRFVSVNDAVGYTVSVEGYSIYVLNFPTARITLAYNYETQQWHKWGYWDVNQAAYQRFRGLTYCYAKDWNLHLVGDYNNGIIYTMSRSVYTDNENPIRSLLRTGHISHGRDVTKRSNIFRLRCKRGVANEAVPDPVVTLKHRTDNSAKWSNERQGKLGQVGQYGPHIDWRRNGIYRTRQYELVHSDATDCVLVKAQENIEALGR